MSETTQNVGYKDLIAKAADQKISPFEFIARLDKDSYDKTIVDKNIRRFNEDIADVVRKKERTAEDLKDSIPGLLREVPSTSEGRIALVNAVLTRIRNINEVESEIEALQDFIELFLETPSME